MPLFSFFSRKNDKKNAPAAPEARRKNAAQPASPLQKAFGEIVGPENVHASPAQLAVYAPRGGVEVAVAPANGEELARCLEFSHGEGFPLQVRGAGTARPVLGDEMDDPASDRRPAVLISLGRMRRIRTEQKCDRTLFAEAGAAAEDVSAAAAKLGLFYPPCPGTGQSSLGGSLALNSGGPNALKYGHARSYVRSLEIFTASGQRMTVRAGRHDAEFYGHGLQLAPLLCGSGARLAIIGRAELALLPRPEEDITLHAVFDDIYGCADAARAVMESSLAPCALEIMDAASAACVFAPGLSPNEAAGRPCVLLRLDGSAAEVSASLGQTQKILPTARRLDPAEAEKAWRGRASLAAALGRNGQAMRFVHIESPLSRLSSLLDGVAEVCGEQGVRAAIFGHAGRPRLHVALYGIEGDEQMEARVRTCEKQLFTLELVLRKAMSSESEMDETRGQWLAARKDSPEQGLLNGIRNLFDPQHRL